MRNPTTFRLDSFLASVDFKLNGNEVNTLKQRKYFIMQTRGSFYCILLLPMICGKVISLFFGPKPNVMVQSVERRCRKFTGSRLA